MKKTWNVSVSRKVETYGSMEKKEKVEFILEQMRLCIAVKDYIRTQIISKKINTKFFQDEGTEVLNLLLRKLLHQWILIYIYMFVCCFFLISWLAFFLGIEA